jgi:transposase InsO family protein
MSIAEMCMMAEVSRAGYYRFLTTPAAGDKDIDLRDAIQRIALEFPAYGRPRMTEELHRRGWEVGPNRVYRIMREDNLLCLRRRKFVLTTNSNHDRPVYPNLAGGMVLTGIDQLWVADITYIRLALEFVYLAVILDAYSRRVIGASDGAGTARAAARLGASLGSRRAVRLPGLHGSSEEPRHHHQHEQEGKSVR